MEWLKELLNGIVPEDKMDSVMEGFKKEFPKHAVPKTDFNTVKEELKIAKANAEQTNVTLEQLKTEVGTVEEYKTKIKDMTTQMETAKAESDKQVSNVIKKVNMEKLLILNKMNESAVDLVVNTINFDEIVIDASGNIVDADKHIGKLKETRGALFLTTTTDSDKKDSDMNKDKKQSGKPIAEMSNEEVMAQYGAVGITRK
jgi:hypothetical protein